MNLWTRNLLTRPLAASGDIRSVSTQESLNVLKGDWTPGLPTSVLPTKVQEKLDKGDKVSSYETAWIPDVSRVKNYMALAERLEEGQKANRDDYLQNAAALLTTLVTKDKLDVPVPIRSWGYAALGYIHKRLGNVEKALQNIEESLALVPDAPAPEILYNAACYNTLLGDYDKALHYLRRALELKPELKQMALDDQDFQGIRNDEQWFRCLGQ